MKKYLSINGNDYEIINYGCKRGQKLYNDVVYGEFKTLYDCYSNPSMDKIIAYDNCKRIAWNLDSAGAVLGYNKFNFTFGFIAKYNEKYRVFVITNKNKYIIM